MLTGLFDNHFSCCRRSYFPHLVYSTVTIVIEGVLEKGGSSCMLGRPGLICFDRCKPWRLWQPVSGSWECQSCTSLGTYTGFSSCALCPKCVFPLKNAFRPQIIFTCSSKCTLTVAFSSTRYRFSIFIYVLLHWRKDLEQTV